MNRSPSHPAISLRAAEVLARRLYEHARFEYAPVSSILNAWTYSEKSSKGLRALSALGQFGLIEVRGTRAGREARLTGPGKRIVLGGGGSDRVYRQALAEAALKPRVHAAVWARFDGRLPADPELARHLVLEHSFNPDTVGRFVRILRDTLSCAALDYTRGVPDGGITDDASDLKRSRASTDGVTLRLALPGGREASLSVPEALSHEEHDLVRAFVDVNLRSMRREVSPR